MFPRGDFSPSSCLRSSTPSGEEASTRLAAILYFSLATSTSPCCAARSPSIRSCVALTSASSRVTNTEPSLATADGDISCKDDEVEPPVFKSLDAMLSATDFDAALLSDRETALLVSGPTLSFVGTGKRSMGGERFGPRLRLLILHAIDGRGRTAGTRISSEGPSGRPTGRPVAAAACSVASVARAATSAPTGSDHLLVESGRPEFSRVCRLSRSSFARRF